MATQPEITRTALEQSLIDLCDRHNLLCADICYNRPDDWDHRWFNVGLQWRDASKTHGRAGASGTADNIAEALSGALTEMHAKRGVAETIADEALPIAEAA